MSSSSRKTKLPIVVVAGRPNVGKSTLFNRLVGRRRAITDAMPGVTRDPVSAEATIGERPVRMVDTGGVGIGENEMDILVAEKSLRTVADADVVILVMDGTETTGEDEDFVDKLRQVADRTVLVVNKIDNPERENLVAAFYEYGFARVVGVSAAHGLGREELEEAVLEILALRCPLPEPEPETTVAVELSNAQEGYESRDEAEIEADAAEEARSAAEAERAEVHPLKLALIGRPNTGKSSLANLLTGGDFSLVSSIPGTTRDVIESEFMHRGVHIQLLDTAGIRRKSKVHDDVEYYSVNRSIQAAEQADVVVLMIDAVDNVAEQDKRLASLVIDRGCAVILALNKWDLLDAISNLEQAMIDRVRFIFPILEFAPIVPLSVIEKRGIDELLKTVLKVHRQQQFHVDTGRLNSALKRWVEVNPPPLVQRRPLKIRYMTQPETSPILFVAFVNRTRGFPEHYRRYLMNCIRKEFGLSSVPIRLELREQKRK